jgi:outer membrane cobalamin receptor
MQISKQRLLAGAGALMLAMNAVAETNSEIVVTATRTAKEIKDVPASVMVISPQAIAASGARTVDDLLKAVPGVDLQSGGRPGTFTRVNMRGLTPGYQSERVLVLVDGRRVNDAYIGNVDFSQIPVDAIERVEVLRGPASALYGSNAEGGVLNIITRRGTATPFTRVKVSAGDFNTQRHSVSHGARVGDVDYAVNAGYFVTDGYMDNSDGSDRDWTARNGSVNVGWTPVSNAEVRTFVDGYQGEGADDNSRHEFRKNSGAVVYRQSWPETSNAGVMARVYRNGENQIYNWNFPGRSEYDLQTLGAELQHSFWVHPDHEVTAGTEFRQDRVDADELGRTFVEEDNIYSAYLQDEWLVAEPLSLTAGVRADYDDAYDMEWSPRVGALVRLSPEYEVFGSYNRAHRAPSLSDRYVTSEYNGFLFKGNPDLKPETLDAYETGVRGRVTERLNVEVAAFWNDMQDAFDFVMEPDGVFQNRNFTRVHSYGVESMARYEVAPVWRLLGQYTWTDGTYEEYPDPQVAGNRLAYLARDKASAGVEYGDPDRYTVGILGRYVSARYADAQNTAATEMDDYVTMDLRSRMRVAKATHLTLDVDNVFDATYQELPDTDHAGRFFMAGLEFVF